LAKEEALANEDLTHSLSGERKPRRRRTCLHQSFGRGCWLRVEVPGTAEKWVTRLGSSAHRRRLAPARMPAQTADQCSVIGS
jgi:hypothetical protein